jgi:protein gp37
MVFVNSMSDLFHVDVPESYIRQIFERMLRVDRHTYQVLTKRPARAARFCRRNEDLFRGKSIPSHIWIGSSVENAEVLHRVDQLREVPAMTRFLSCEPLLGPLTLDLNGIHWVIVGGESGPEYRPVDLACVRGIRDQCLAQNVAFFFKQVGGRTPKAHGRTLDDRTWDEWPIIQAEAQSVSLAAPA